jgi:hypothetical protein
MLRVQTKKPTLPDELFSLMGWGLPHSALYAFLLLVFRFSLFKVAPKVAPLWF